MKRLILIDCEQHYEVLENPFIALLHTMLEDERIALSVYTKNIGIRTAATKLGVPVYSLPEKTSIPLLQWWRYRRLLRTPDAVIHLWGTSAASTVLPFYAKYGTTPCITTLFTMPGYNNDTLQKLYDNVTRVVCPTRAFLNTFVHMARFPQVRTSVIPIGITPELYLERDKRNSRIIYTVVADLVENASLIEILEALSVLHKAGMIRDWEVRFVGDGPLFSQIVEKATELGIVDNIAILGTMAFADIIADSSYVVVPAYTQITSQVLYAAVKLRLPIIAAQELNILDILGANFPQHLTFVPHDAQSLRSAIKYALDFSESITLPLCIMQDTMREYKALYEQLLAI